MVGPSHSVTGNADVGAYFNGPFKNKGHTLQRMHTLN